MSRPLWRGHVRIDAVWLDPALIGAAEVQRRALRLWSPGVQLRHLGGGVLVLGVPGQGRWEAVEAQAGLPLCWDGARLRAAPEGVEAAGAAPGRVPEGLAVVWWRGGAQREEPVGALIDPAGWLDLELPAVEAGEPLGDPPPPLIAPPAAAAPDLRARAVAVDPKTEQMIAALADAPARVYPAWASGWLGGLLRNLTARPGASGGAAGSGAAAPGTLPAAAGGPGLLGWLGALLGLGGRAGGAGGAGAAAGAGGTGLAVRPGPVPPAPLPAGPDWRERLAMLLAKSGLYGVVMERQQRYLDEMIERFEKGDLADALRRALPLGGGESGQPGGLSLSWGQPRDTLDLTAQPAGRRTVMPLGDDMMDRLKKLYEQALARLEKEGRIDEAAFVLSGLLREHEKAVSLLERHGRFRDAAKLAEARVAAPALAIRLWLLAGEEGHAIWLARRHGSFGELLVALQTKFPDAAERLRWLWASSLADRGDLSAAVQAIWPSADQRGKALPWISEVVDQPGAAGEAALPWLLMLAPDRLPEAQARVRALLAEEGEEATERRAQLWRQLRTVAPPAAAGLSRGLARRLWLERPTEDGLHAVDPLLRETFPARAPAGAAPKWPRERRIAAWDRGSRAVHDACLLATGHLLVAFGEGGVELREASGALLRRFDVPAHALVPADKGRVALALARRGSVQQIHWLELERGRARWIADLPIDRWASTFDGERWVVTGAGELMVLDAADLQRVLWRVTKLGAVLAVHRNPVSIAMLCLPADALPRPAPGQEISPETPVRAERWIYGATGMALRQRAEMPPVALAQIGGAGLLPIGMHCVGFCLQGGLIWDPVPEGSAPDGKGWRGAVAGDGMVAGVLEGGAVEVRRVSMHNNKPVFSADGYRLLLEGTRELCVRLQDGVVMAGDERGRVIGVRVVDGRVVVDGRF